jgi:hypothetical protein
LGYPLGFFAYEGGVGGDVLRGIFSFRPYAEVSYLTLVAFEAYVFTGVYASGVLQSWRDRHHKALFFLARVAPTLAPQVTSVHSVARADGGLAVGVRVDRL